MVYIIIKAAENTEHYDLIDTEESPLFTTNFIALAGIFIYAFQPHDMISSVLRNNKEPSNN